MHASSLETLEDSACPAADECLQIRGARVHNLKNVDLDIPRDRLVVITGPSGSGKSSLAFDTLYAEGQRQYIESLSVYARQFLHQMQRPDVDLIEGLQPTISVDQRAGAVNPRSTVATVTEIYDYLRLLYARVGNAHCYQCGSPIKQQSPEQIVEDLAALPAGSKAMLLAPLVRGRKGAHKDVLAAVRKAGFVRLRIDGQIVDLDQAPELAPRKTHSIDAVVDRVVIREGVESRLAESVQLAITHGEGAVAVLYQTPADKDAATAQGQEPGWQEQLFSTLYACPQCKISYAELEPRTFSFNSPYGACPTCEGLGTRIEFDPDLVLPDWELSLTGGAVISWRNASAEALQRHREDLTPLLAVEGLSWDSPLGKLTAAQRKVLLRGDGTNLGLLTLLEKQYAVAVEAAEREALEAFRGPVPCPDCGGSRLRPEGRACTVGGLAIHELTGRTVRVAGAFFAGLVFRPSEAPIGQPIVREIAKRLAFLDRVGVEYLTLDRASDTLSGGELQRVRLATGIGTGLVGVCYVLDEPSIGLHQRDNQRLIEALRDLQQLGNTVLVVEHDEAMMRAADHLIDMGPGAGVHGGEVVAQGTPAEVSQNPQSPTGRYLSGHTRIEVPATRRAIDKDRRLSLRGATMHNLQDVDLDVPLSVFVCVTGVSGSGKSSLVNETLVRAAARQLNGAGPKPGPYRQLVGLEQIDKLIEIDQSALGRTPRSNPATYTGLFDEIRKVFAGTRDARQRGYKVGRFSFNVKGGRCEECQGQGIKRIEMKFLPDLLVPCPECHGTRFNAQTLQVKYRDRSIAEVLDLPVSSALEFFENFPHMQRTLRSLQDVGLGYLTLGQSATTLSGGEAQRVKLAAELARVQTGRTLYVLDEPTTGLHFGDIQNLLKVLNQLVELGNTVLVIEHNLDVIKTADWNIDVGPEGGAAGGQIVAQGTPEQIAATQGSHTGRFLQELLPPAR